MWHGSMHGWGPGPDEWWGMGLHLVVPVTFWVLMIALAVVALRALWRVGSGGRGDGPRAILEARFARGEIDSDEFRRRKQDLN